jgi:hypothetical protein
MVDQMSTRDGFVNTHQTYVPHLTRLRRQVEHPFERPPTFTMIAASTKAWFGAQWAKVVFATWMGGVVEGVRLSLQLWYLAWR